MFRSTVAALLASVAATLAHTQVPGGEPVIPGMAMHVIEEPVFKGRIAVFETGRGKARSILLVHGIGVDGARDFSHPIAWLRESFHVVALDLPGFGRSDRANELYSPANYVGVLKFVADRFVGRPFVLVGHSLGGVVALRYAAAHPADVERLVVIATPGILHRHATSSRYLARLMGVSQKEFDLLGWLSRLPGKLLTPLERLGADPQTVLADPELRERVLGGDPGQIAGLAVVNDDLHRELPSIRADTLIVWGREDTLAPLRNGRVLALTLPRARLELIEGAGHTPMQETPRDFQEVLERFLVNGLPRGAAGDAVSLPQHGDKSCRRERGRVFEGDYDKLTLESCTQVNIRNARIWELRILGSTVTIDDSHIGGGKTGMSVRNSTVVLTGGRIEGDVAISAYASRLDLAAVEVEGREAAVKAPRRSYVVFSLSRLNSPYTHGEVHEFYTVTDSSPR